MEITEHSISSELIAEVRKLKGEGFLVAVDDFGTGYSNLKSVTQLAPDLLKIDGSFVYELEAATVPRWRKASRVRTRWRCCWLQVCTMARDMRWRGRWGSRLWWGSWRRKGWRLGPKADLRATAAVLDCL